MMLPQETDRLRVKILVRILCHTVFFQKAGPFDRIIGHSIIFFICIAECSAANRLRTNEMAKEIEKGKWFALT